ncbi:helix-turn-helix domain-containing protein [Salinithrix halophila]|uniref:Helix-turn-helix domain-containing protein n=1 Tax=Salinithrix halophila TaxID=1485204 RepID=A0ABV8JL21_9BACL
MSIEIGHRLKQARESRGISLNALEQETRIPREYLAALETGDFKSIESSYYIRAYLRTYASAVGLNSREILNQYRMFRRTGGSQPGSPDIQTGSLRSAPLRGGEEAPLQLPENPGGLSRDRSRKPESLPPGDDGGGDLQRPSRMSRLSRSERGASRSEQISTGREDGNFPHTETAAGLGTPADGGLRRVSMPPDLPAPQELGLPPRQDGEPSEESPPEGGSSPSRSLSRSNRSSSKEKESSGKKSTLGTWYTRFLILGAILLIPAAIFVAMKVYGDDANPAPQKPPKQESPAPKEEAAEEVSSSEAEALLRPVDVGSGKIDHYELSNADQIELKLKAKGECWFQIRGQEVGNQLEDRLLKKGDTFSFDYSKGKDLWIEMGLPNNVDMTVNGEEVKTSYDGRKKIHISLVK